MKQSRLDQLQNLEIDASPEVWVNISKALPQKKKRRFIFWIFSFAIVVSSGLLILNSKTENKINHSPDTKIISDQNNKLNTAKPEVVYESGIESPSKQKGAESVERKNDGSGLNKFNNSSENNNHSVKTITTPVTTSSGNASAISMEDQTTADLTAELTTIPIEPFLISDSSETEIAIRDIEIRKEKKLSRWSLYAGLGMTFSDFHSPPDSIDALTSSIRSINNMSFNFGARYDVSTKIRVAIGISNLILSQERTGMNAIYLIGTPGEPNNMYDIITPLGTINGSASVFDQTYFQSDSVLYPFVFSASVLPPDTKSLEFTLREEFTYINVPVSVSYKWNRKLVTASAGVVFTTNILTGYKLYLDGRQLDFKYYEKVANNTFSGGLIAGLDFHLSKAFDLFINGHYEKNFNSVIGEKSFYNPIVWRLNAGFCYRPGR